MPALPADQSGRRQDFGDWLASKDNPLTRLGVMVNRTWHWLLGSGLVRTATDNFGTTGELPSHRELLDHWPSASSRTAGR